jgi:hypothetical protein|uniref:Uncharacterized protein n=1 Tax=Bacteriophage sp. TaxID=38018 RepID=A0A7G9A452_9VIRU|nr:MAG: hypothetical protein [Bacteriophage sp.]
MDKLLQLLRLYNPMKAIEASLSNFPLTDDFAQQVAINDRTYLDIVSDTGIGEFRYEWVQFNPMSHADMLVMSEHMALVLDFGYLYTYIKHDLNDVAIVLEYRAAFNYATLNKEKMDKFLGRAGRAVHVLNSYTESYAKNRKREVIEDLVSQGITLDGDNMDILDFSSLNTDSSEDDDGNDGIGSPN